MSNPTNFYETGFLHPDREKIRIKQGLYPQTIANLCMYSTPPVKDTDCINKNLYPALQVDYKYSGNKVPSNCPCLNYIKAP